jgi:hypothetical protein
VGGAGTAEPWASPHGRLESRPYNNGGQGAQYTEQAGSLRYRYTAQAEACGYIVEVIAIDFEQILAMAAWSWQARQPKAVRQATPGLINSAS